MPGPSTRTRKTVAVTIFAKRVAVTIFRRLRLRAERVQRGAMKKLLLLAALGAAAPAFPSPASRRCARSPTRCRRQRLRATVERLVGFGTRHTLSVRDHPTRGIGAALNWTEAEFRRISRACGGCLTIVRPSDTVTNRRIPTPTLVEDVVAIQRGTERSRTGSIVITGHIDSRVTDPMNATVRRARRQ